MAQRLAGGNLALALLCNTLPTGAMLTVDTIFGPVSGAHFNPAVSLVAALRRALPWRDAGLYIATQVCGALVGAWAAHAMFELPLWQISLTVRSGWGQWLAEFVATFGLVLTILGCAVVARHAVAYAVGLYITAAYWFTASTSFANPSMTIARSMSDTSWALHPPVSPLHFDAAQWRSGGSRRGTLVLAARFLEARYERQLLMLWTAPPRARERHGCGCC